MVRYNVGVMLGMSDLTEDLFHATIHKITSNKSYYDNINRISDIFRNNPVDPLESAVFWIEYVIKYKGAYHLKSTAINLNWYQYLLLDVFGTIAIAVFLAIYLVKKILIFIARKIFKGQKKKKDKMT
jgi:glucuronosyltransferase